MLDVSGINLQHDGNRNCSRSKPELGQFKTQLSIGIAAKYPVPLCISAELESTVLMPRHVLIRKEFHQNLRHLALDKGAVLRSIPFLPHVNDFEIAVHNGPHQANRVFGRVPAECARSVRKRWMHPHPEVECLQQLQPAAGPDWNFHGRLHLNVLQQQLNVISVHVYMNLRPLPLVWGM